MTDTLTMIDDEPRTGRRMVWSKAARDLLFERLVDRFGPYATWEKSHSPGRGLDDEYDEFCEAFAKTIGANSIRAVRQQVNFALGVSTDNEHHWRAAQARVAILNMAAAFEAGFIENSTFPDLVATKATRGE